MKVGKKLISKEGRKLKERKRMKEKERNIKRTE